MSRLDDLIEWSRYLVQTVREDYEDRQYEITGIVGLFSGGNDSTTMAHLMRDVVTHYAHANTQIGIEETRQYVRDTCSSWSIPLLERFPTPGEGYRELVLGQVKPSTYRAKYPVVWPGGFPGPGQHSMFFQRLKERQLAEIRREFNPRPRNQRVIYLAGRRKSESLRRTSRFMRGEMAEVDERGSIIYISPMLDWTTQDLNEYRRRFSDVPHNEVADNLHMSGECLCGCFARPGELSEIRFFYPRRAEEIDQLQWEVNRADLDIPEKYKLWGNGNGGQCPSGLCNT